jgi:uncharacterized membrane protein
MTDPDADAPDGGNGSETQTSVDPARVRDLLAEIDDDPSTVASLIGHFYRGEMDRTTAWRNRLDQTTNWAVVVVAAILTWAFTSADNPHYVILIGMLAVIVFLVMEANRYREYDIWRTRVRILQENVFAELYASRIDPDTDWGTRLGEDLRDPTFTISYRRALSHRLRRIYLGLLSILLASWVARVTVFQPNEPWRQTAAIPGIPGEVVVAVVATVYAVSVALSVQSWSGSVREFER